MAAFIVEVKQRSRRHGTSQRPAGELACLALGQSGAWSADVNRPEVVHIGQSRPRYDGVAQGLKEAVSIVAVKAGARSDALRPGSLQSVRGDHGAGDFCCAVNTVGIAGHRVNAGQSIKGKGQ